MNKTLIYKEDVIKLLNELENKVAEAEGWQEKCDGIFQANQIVQKMDPVDAKLTLYALWDLVTLKRNFGTLNGIRCSHCGNEHVHSNLLSYPNYCSNCGAKMILEGIYKMPCIMPEQPYCPACHYGLIVPDENDGSFCEWICLLEEEDC